jgi:AraC-like DNA-binding protein
LHKRVVYLDRPVLDGRLIGAAVDRPTLHDPVLRRRVDQLRGALAHPANALEAESRLAFIFERLGQHLRPEMNSSEPDADGVAARQLMLAGAPLAEVAAGAGIYDQAHLTRHFRRYVGVSPARYRAT